ncbi:MAG: SemiSWEET transporter [Candidatus Woesearchaeota archaeon]
MIDYITIIGFVAATATTTAFVPQAFHTLKTRSTKDINLSMYIIFCIGVFLWLVYGILLNSWPIIIANILTLILGLAILIMKVRYG